MSHTVLYPAEIFDLGICDMFGLIPKSGFSYKIHWFSMVSDSSFSFLLILILSL